MPAKNKGWLANNLCKIYQKSPKNINFLKPRFWSTFFIFLGQFGRPKSIPNHPKSVDFGDQNLEGKKCKFWDATTIIGGSNLGPFCSLGGRGETTKPSNTGHRLRISQRQWAKGPANLCDISVSSEFTSYTDTFNKITIASK